MFLHPFRHRFFWAANQAEILSAAKRAETADVEQMKKTVPLITCEFTFGQYVCEMMFGVDVSDFKFWDPIQFGQTTSQEQLGGFLIRWTSSDNHLDNRFVVLKNIQRSTKF